MAFLDKEKVVESEKDHVLGGGLDTRSARWGRRGVIASLLVGMGALAVKSFSWLHFSPTDGGEYQVIAEWHAPTGGKGLVIAVSPHSSSEELRALGSRLQEQFRRLDNAAVMIFDDADGHGRSTKVPAWSLKSNFRQRWFVSERCISRARPEARIVSRSINRILWLTK